MAEPEGADSYRPTEIPAERLTEFLTAKNAKTVCPVCSAHDWVNMEDADNRGFVITSQGADGGTGRKSMPLAVLVCKNCHFVWLMARRPIENWLREHKHGDD